MSPGEPAPGEADGKRRRRAGPVTRLRKRLLPRLATTTAWAGLLILGVWAISRWQTDQQWWSQYLWWIPTLYYAVVAGVLLGLSKALEMVSLRLGGTAARPLLTLALVGVLGFVGWTWRPWLLVAGRGPGEVRVSYWNLAWNVPPPDTLDALDADVMIVMNPKAGRPSMDFRDAVVERAVLGAPPEPSVPDETLVAPAVIDTHTTPLLSGFVASRYPIVRTGSARLEQRTSWRGSTLSAHQNGVAFVEFDRSADGEPPMIVWVVDLPSSLYAPRAEVAGDAVELIESWAGPERHAMPTGTWLPQQPGEPGFPAPDLIIGDFNATRGSASVAWIAALLGEGWSESHGAAGVGPGTTFRTDGRALWVRLAIDQALASAGWRFTRSRAVELHASPHKALVVELSRRR